MVFFLGNFPASQPVSNYNSMWKNNWLPPELPLLWKKKMNNSYVRREKPLWSQQQCLPQQNNFFGFVAGPKEKYVCGERRNPKKERKKSIFMAALTLITDTKRALLPLQCIYNTYISRGSTMETQSFVYNHFVLTLLLESESRFVNKYNQPRIGKNNASARNGNGMQYSGRN